MYAEADDSGKLLFTAAFVRCDLCTKEWTAVYPLSCKRLECPNCNNMVTFEIIKTGDDND